MMDHEFRSDEDRLEPRVADEKALGRLNENWSCIIGTRTGGQGKTLTTQLISEALRAGGVAPMLVSVDTDARAEGRSKLGLLHPETKDLAIAPDLADLAEGHGEKALDHWDAFGRVLRERNAVTDLGANVIGQMLRWAQIAKPVRLMTGREVNFLVVVTAQEKSAADALATLAEIEATRGAMAIGKIGVVMNEAHGKFGSGPQMQALRKQIVAKSYPVIAIKRCHAYSHDDSIAIGRLVTIGWEEYQRLRGLDEEMTAMRNLDSVQTWIEETFAAIRGAGFAPPKAA